MSQIWHVFFADLHLYKLPKSSSFQTPNFHPKFMKTRAQNLRSPNDYRFNFIELSYVYTRAAVRVFWGMIPKICQGLSNYVYLFQEDQIGQHFRLKWPKQHASIWLNPLNYQHVSLHNTWIAGFFQIFCWSWRWTKCSYWRDQKMLRSSLSYLGESTIRTPWRPWKNVFFTWRVR